MGPDRDAELQECQRRFWSGRRYFQKGNRPMPHDPDNTVFVDAGPLRIGVEARALNPAVVNAHLDSVRLTDNTGFGATTRSRQFEDGGPSVHVFGADDGFEYLRFDCFADDPHYHYIVPGLDGVVKMAFDPFANGDVREWVIDRLRTRLPLMLRTAGAGQLANHTEAAVIESAIDEVERLLLAAPRDL